MFILWGLSWVYVVFGNLPWLAAIFYGLKPAIMAIVAFAVLRIGAKALKNEVMWSIAAVAFVAIYVLEVPFPAIVIGAAILGFAGGRIWPRKFAVQAGHAQPGERSVIDDDSFVPEHARPSLTRAIRVAAACLLLWWIPLLALGIYAGWQSTVFQEGLFFSKAAVVTFGGAYAVLPYVAQHAVEQHGWLTAAQMMDGLGLAETTPGPLIMVTQFVGFLGAWQNPGPLPPLAAATLGALITTWSTFLPCFLWTLVGAPHIEQLRGNVTVTAALSAVTAAVVGVVLNLAVWFGLHVLFPRPGTVDWFAAALAGVAFAGMVRWKWGVIPVVAGAALVGWLYQAIF
jgi:chromate transporter